MRYFFFLLLLWLQPLLAQSYNPAHLDSALSYVGITELTNKNDGPEVETFLKYVGRVKGNAWCAAYASYVKDLPGTIIEPKVKSGLARHFESRSPDRLVVKASKVLMGLKTIPRGSFVVWQRGETVFGHVGLVREDWSGASGKTVEGNTSSGKTGNQSDGDGVYKRNRTIYPGNFWRIKWFVKFEEEPKYYPILMESKPLTTLETLNKVWNIILEFVDVGEK